MTDLNALAAKIHQIAVDHGWWEEDRNFDEMCFLMTTELAEAFEEYRAGRPLEWFQFNGMRAYRVTDGSGADWTSDCDGLSGVVGEFTWTGVVPKPDGVAVELADCAIRALDTLQGGSSVRSNWSVEIAQNRRYLKPTPENVGAAFRRIDSMINKAADLYVLSPDDSATSLLVVIVMCEELATKLGCEDFWAVVKEKMAYNDTRSYRHGGKLA